MDTFSFREPLGVVAGITPFNFPAMVPMWMFPVAIACGNTFVLKPSERDPSASLLIAELWQRGRAARRRLQRRARRQGRGRRDPRLARRRGGLVRRLDADRAATSTSAAAANGKRVQALGGAKNHAIVLPDADIDFAADHLAAAAFGSAGERCMAISAAVAVGAAGDAVVEAVTERARAVKVGPGRDAASEMGPVVTREAQQRILGLIDTGEKQGAAIAVDGRELRRPGPRGRLLRRPHRDRRGRAPRWTSTPQEIFGPVLSVVRADTVDEAIALINANPYGNGTAIFTSSGEAARRFQRGVNVGMIGINVPVPVPMAFYSFGGWKDSLFGDKHVHGPEGVSFYTRAKVVTARWPQQSHASDASFHFPTSK